MNEVEIKRREFIKFMGIGLCSSPFISFIGCDILKKSQASFNHITSTKVNDLILAKGLKYKILASYLDKINKNEFYGFNNDFTATIPIDQKSAYLIVNHEYHNSKIVSGYKGGNRKKSEIYKERKSVGISLLMLKKSYPSWEIDFKSKFNKRYDATSKIPFYPKVKIKDKNYAIGTFANCAGGLTPWGTFLSCEENYQKFIGESNFFTKKTKFL